MMDADRELKRICGALCYEVPKKIVDDVYARVSILLVEKDDEIVRLLEMITQWETSTGLATSAGDPDGITPEQNQSEIERLRAIETAALAMTTHYDACDECQEDGSCAEAFELWMAIKTALTCAEGDRIAARPF